MGIIRKQINRMFNIALMIVIFAVLSCNVYAEDSSASVSSYGDSVCKSYCWGVKNSDHKIAHNTAIKGTGKTNEDAVKNHNSKMKAHKNSMPSHSHNGKYFPL